MLSIQWNNNLMSVGVDIIDEQHKKLFELVNEVIVSIENQTQIQNIKEVLNKAADYANYHFKTEEKLLKELKLNKNDMDNHIKKHQKFINKINEFKNKELIAENNSIECFNSLDRYLCDWLVHHILKEDKEAFRNLQNN